jgi:hypothetical protein
VRSAICQARMAYPPASGCSAAAEHPPCAHCGSGGLVAPVRSGIARAIDAVGCCDGAVDCCDGAVGRCDEAVGAELGAPFEDELDDGGADTLAAGVLDPPDDPDWHPATTVATSSPARAYQADP